MSGENPNDPFKGVDWKGIGSEMQKDPSASVKQVAKNRHHTRRIREIPEYYFLPRYSWPKTISIYGSCIAAGIGTAMLLQTWIDSKVKEDGGGVVWVFDK